MAVTAGTKWQPSLQHVRTAETSKKADVVKPPCQEAPPLDQACESERIISKFELLAVRVVSMQNQSPHSQDRCGLHTVSSAIVSPSLKPSPPPGLLAPPGLEAPCDVSPLVDEVSSQKSDSAPLSHANHIGEDITAKGHASSEVAPASLSEPAQYKVLLQNLPELMLKECMLRVMLEQAGLNDVMAVTFTTRKTLITLASYASACQCIAHFSGRQWGSSGKPVTATFVRAKVEAKTMSSDTPSFVPGAQCFARGYGGA